MAPSLCYERIWIILLQFLMTLPADEVDCPSGCRAQFTTTHWSMVLAAAQGETQEAAAALEALCSRYWYPLYAYVRRCGHAPHDAQDLTQGFFARLLAKDDLKAVRRSKGRFRSFLLAALKHFLANEWRNARAQKRCGNIALLSLDELGAESRYLQAPGSILSPEKFFEQQWATALLEQVLARLREEFTAARKAVLFHELKVFLTGEKRSVSFAQLAVKLGTTEAALKMAVSRLRHRYGELLREEIGKTVSSSGEIEGELRALFAALSP
jgi:RNA polymerase sigma factor (sigma-70 family)